MTYNDLGRHAPSCPFALTKAEVGALLTRGACAADVTSIAEFAGVSTWEKNKSGNWKDRDVDYVWVVRATDKCPKGTDCHGSKWIVLAAFEVEGYPCANDKTAPEKDADSLSICARETSIHAPGSLPILSTILFTVHPSGTRPWGADTFASLDKSSLRMKGVVDSRIRAWLQKHSTGADIKTFIDKELIDEPAPVINTWIKRAGDLARDLRARGIAR